MITARDKGKRLRRFCEAYGWDAPAAIVEITPGQLRWYAENIEREARSGHPGFAKLMTWGVPDGHRRDADVLARDARELKAGASD